MSEGRAGFAFHGVFVPAERIRRIEYRVRRDPEALKDLLERGVITTDVTIYLWPKWTLPR